MRFVSFTFHCSLTVNCEKLEIHVTSTSVAVGRVSAVFWSSDQNHGGKQKLIYNFSAPKIQTVLSNLRLIYLLSVVYWVLHCHTAQTSYISNKLYVHVSMHPIINLIEPTRCDRVVEFIISVFLNYSTCFGRHTAHHQELQNSNCSL